MILVDSCMYIDWMRAGENPVQRLQPHHSNLVSCGIVHLEVLRGITTPRVKAYLTDFFTLLPQVSLSANLLARIFHTLAGLTALGRDSVVRSRAKGTLRCAAALPKRCGGIFSVPARLDRRCSLQNRA